MNQKVPVKRRKKMIEVAIPLENINAISSREKSIRQGHPNTFHLWWSRKPISTARAIILCQLIDDPSALVEEFPSKKEQDIERKRLFEVISELAKWENTSNQKLINQAKKEIEKSWVRCCNDNKDHPDAPLIFNPKKLPGFHDPFSGGGSIPMEAKRLGLDTISSDLNPVAVMINKALLEIPPKFSGLKAVNKNSQKQQKILNNQRNLEGLSEDIIFYGDLIRKKAYKLIGDLYPDITITKEIVNTHPDLPYLLNKNLKVIAYLWAINIKCPNPACYKETPLLSSFYISSK